MAFIRSGVAIWPFIAHFRDGRVGRGSSVEQGEPRQGNPELARDATHIFFTAGDARHQPTTVAGSPERFEDRPVGAPGDRDGHRFPLPVRSAEQLIPPCEGHGTGPWTI
jgi:hypothetical protein